MSSRIDASLFEPVKTKRTFEEVLDQIVDRIRMGELREGDVLPSERALATSMNVSRPIIRQAFAALVDAGVVEIKQGPTGGAQVKSMWVPEDLIERQLELKTDEMFELLEARRALEPRVAQLACLRGTDEEFMRMEESITLMRANVDDRFKLLQADLVFHRCIWQASGNATLEGLMRSLWRRLEVARDMILRTASDTSVAIDLHKQTLAALRRGDPVGVEHEMDNHLGHLEELCEQAVNRPRIRPMPGFLKAGEWRDGALSQPVSSRDPRSAV
jgi:DNA-binding FadR family transcriptional regulator